MPWKNGLGTTTELAVDPKGAGIDAFAWRVSIADLGASGPFSRFPGYDRILVQIEGEPMTLAHEGGAEQRLALLVPYRFAGEVATHGTLGAGPARDFNVMVRRERARADLVVRVCAAGESVVGRGDDAETRMVFVLRGSMSGAGIEVAAGEMVIAPPGAEIALVAKDEGATAFVITIAPAY
jgi:environmental stress-induced protein Ves